MDYLEEGIMCGPTTTTTTREDDEGAAPNKKKCIKEMEAKKE